MNNITIACPAKLNLNLYVLKKKKYNVIISDFVLSCRVLYRYVEQYMLFNIIEKYPTRKVVITYKKTNVNSSLIPNFLKKQYFIPKKYEK